jgi:hypothetical protein
MDKYIDIAQPSSKSLFIEMKFQGSDLATGTAFILNSNKGPVLITNGHNVTGKDQNSGQALSSHGGVPDSITIWHHENNNLGKWIEKTEPLYNEEGEPLWIEHPILKKKADFVALLLTQLDDVQLHPYIEANNFAFLVVPSDTVSVIGFPFRLKIGGYFAVWATGFMATDPDLDYDGLPIFLIDCRSRKGQSGSPVVAYRSDGVVPMGNGVIRQYATPAYNFLGIYSGRINDESDLGIVWKKSAIQELVNSI